MKTTTNYGLKKPDGTDLVDIADLNYNADKIDAELKKGTVIATTAANGLMAAADKVKLNGIAVGANKTIIANNLTTTAAGSALDAAQGKVLDGKISAVNNSLTAETTDRQNAVAACLLLTGGELSGDLRVKRSVPSVFLKNTDTGDETQITANGDMTIIRNYSHMGGANFTDLRLNSYSKDLVGQITILRDGATYKLYGEHNITVSQAAPTTTLASGCMHNVY